MTKKPARQGLLALASMIALAAALTGLGCSARSGSGSMDQAPDRAPAEPVDSRMDDFGQGPGRAGTMDDRGLDEQALDARRRAMLVEERLEDVFFAFDKSNLTWEARETLAANARVLRENPDVAVVIEGHCDERGTNEYNLALGERRARSVRDYLTQSGVAIDRLTVVSYGEERPFALGHDETAWALNRRAHFRLR